MTSETILAIESAISSGSVALIAGGRTVGSWSSAEKVSRSEELLPRIAEMLESTGTRRSDLARIAVSNGPGSYTGIRIGLSTAMGLAAALGIPCTGVSLLKSLAFTSREHGERVIVVPIGRDGFCWQHFDENKEDAKGSLPISGKLDELKSSLREHPAAAILAQTDAFEALVEAMSVTEARTLDLGRDLAISVGLYSTEADDGLQPFYARDIPIAPSAGVIN